MSLSFEAEQAKKEEYLSRFTKANEKVEDLKVIVQNLESEKEGLGRKLEFFKARLVEEKKKLAAVAERSREEAARAVKDFKASEEYKEAIVEGGLKAFQFGFEGCRKQVVQLYPDLDLSGLNVPDADAGEPTLQESAGGDAAETPAEQPEVASARASVGPST